MRISKSLQILRTAQLSNLQGQMNVSLRYDHSHAQHNRKSYYFNSSYGNMTIDLGGLIMRIIPLE